MFDRYHSPILLVFGRSICHVFILLFLHGLHNAAPDLVEDICRALQSSPPEGSAALRLEMKRSTEQRPTRSYPIVKAHAIYEQPVLTISLEVLYAAFHKHSTIFDPAFESVGYSQAASGGTACFWPFISGTAISSRYCVCYSLSFCRHSGDARLALRPEGCLIFHDICDGRLRRGAAGEQGWDGQ